jgi:hypothetical protein
MASAETDLTVPTSDICGQPTTFAAKFVDPSLTDSLRVVAKPVAKVDARDGELVELLAVPGPGHGDVEEGIFDVAVAPCWSTPVSFVVLEVGPLRDARKVRTCEDQLSGETRLTVDAFNLAERADVASTEGEGRLRQADQDDQPDPERGNPEINHVGFSLRVVSMSFPYKT